MNVAVSLPGLLVAAIAAIVVVFFSVWLDRRRNPVRTRWVDRLEIDGAGFTYTGMEPYSESARWAEVGRVLFYYGEPDFPDPLAGMTPVAEWQFVSLPDHRSAHVPHSTRHTARLAAACEKHLPGFDAPTLREVSRLEREGHWVLWERSHTADGSTA